MSYIGNPPGPPQPPVTHITREELEYTTIQLSFQIKNLSLTGFSQKSDKQTGMLPPMATDARGNRRLSYIEAYYDIPAAKNLLVRVKGYFDDFAEKMRHENEPGTNGPPYTAGNLFQEKLGGELFINYKLCDYVDIIGSVLKEDINFDTSSNDTSPDIKPDRTRKLDAFFVETIIDFKKMNDMRNIHNLTLTAGFRYDHYSDFGSARVPRFGLVFAPSEKIYYKALYGEAFRAPFIQELFMKTPRIKGNSNLKEENIKSLEFLVGYK